MKIESRRFAIRFKSIRLSLLRNLEPITLNFIFNLEDDFDKFRKKKSFVVRRRKKGVTEKGRVLASITIHVSFIETL